METLRQNIIDERKAKNLTQEKIAILLNLPTNTYGSWERGQSEPSAEMLIKLADIFECSVDYLLGRASNGLSYEENNLITMFRKLDKQGQVKLYAIVQAYVS